MFSYRAYGLGIESEIPLSALTESSPCPDVQIRRGKVSFPSAAKGRKTWITVTEAYFRFDGIGVIRVSHGREMVVEIAAGVDDGTIGLFILGPALGVLLHQRGLLVLHGSAVALNAGVVAFLGMSGWGKSTMAGALGKLGHMVFADDFVGVSLEHDRPVAFPGFPRLKLGLDAADTLGYPAHSSQPLLPSDERREFSVEGASPWVPRHLERIYVLAEGEAPAIEPLEPQDAVVELIRHSYAVPCLKGSGSSAEHLRHCASLVNALPVYTLRRPLNLELIHELAKLVEWDLGVDHKEAEVPQCASYSHFARPSD